MFNYLQQELNNLVDTFKRFIQDIASDALGKQDKGNNPYEVLECYDQAEKQR